MSYIGNSPTNIAFQTDTFSGTGSTTAFTMSVAPANTTSVLVAVTGVLQDPSTYSVSGTTLTFSAAPPSGTSNISVRYLGIPASGVTTTAYRTVTNTTATAGQTSFTIPSYTVGYIDVFRNGVYLPTTDYTATTGTTVVLTNAATVGDTITTSSFFVSSVLNALPTTGGTLSGNLVVSGTETVSTITSPAATALTLQTNNGTTAITVDTSQNVGIGTSSPGTQLNVYKSTATTVNIRPQNSLAYADFGPQSDGSVYAPYATPAASTQLVVGTSNSNPFTFYTNGSERMRIDSSGRLLIGTTTSGTYFDGPLCAYNASALVASFKTDSATAYPLACYNTATSGNNLFITFLTEGTPTTRGYIDYNRAGTAVRYNTSSDERLKKNIVDSGSAIPLINSIKIRSYDWKETDSHVDFGVIAQELNNVAPDAVSEGTIGDDMTKTWGVDTSTLVPALVKAIQEQQALINQLQADVAALKGKP